MDGFFPDYMHTQTRIKAIEPSIGNKSEVPRAKPIECESLQARASLKRRKTSRDDQTQLAPPEKKIACGPDRRKITCWPKENKRTCRRINYSSYGSRRPQVKLEESYKTFRFEALERYLKHILEFARSPKELTLEEALDFKRKLGLVACTKAFRINEENKRTISKVKSVLRHVLSLRIGRMQMVDVVEVYFAPLGKRKEARRCYEEILRANAFVNHAQYLRFVHACARNYLTDQEKTSLTAEIQAHSEELESWLSDKLCQCLDNFLKDNSQSCSSELIKYFLVSHSLLKSELTHFELTFCEHIPIETRKRLARIVAYIGGAISSWNAVHYERNQNGILHMQFDFVSACLEGVISLPDQGQLYERIKYLMAKIFDSKDNRWLGAVWGLYHRYYKCLNETDPFDERLDRIIAGVRRTDLARLKRQIVSFKRDFPYITDNILDTLKHAEMLYHARCYEASQDSQNRIYHKNRALWIAQAAVNKTHSASIRATLISVFSLVGTVDLAWKYYHDTEALGVPAQQSRSFMESVLKLIVSDASVSSRKKNALLLKTIEKYAGKKVYQTI